MSITVSKEQLRENFRNGCKGLNIPTEFLQIISGIVWDTTVSADERVNRIQILLQEASTTK